MNRKAFTLIELLVVVAIIGILAAVGVVAYSGYTNSAKKSVIKANHNAFEKKVALVLQQCNIEGSVSLKKNSPISIELVISNKKKAIGLKYANKQKIERKIINFIRPKKAEKKILSLLNKRKIKFILYVTI